MSRLPVAVVGAGPVGLLTALRLAQQSVPILLIEANESIIESPRAMAYQPVAVEQLDKAGVLSDVRKVGGAGNGICWRRTKEGDMIALLERGISPEYPYENLVIGQHELAGIILDHLGKIRGVDVRWGRKVVGLSEGADKVTLTMETEQGQKEEVEVAYVVGADGGHSAVRKLAGIGFEGWTWDQQLVSTNVEFPFNEYGWPDANFLIDPEHFALIAHIKGDLWRVSYGEIGGLSHDELRARLPMKYEALFPGPKPLKYNLVQFSPYRIHQKCATTFRKGRVLLAGDAAHLCNPFGGLGLTGGLLDAACLADALGPVYNGQAPGALLDSYALLRRDIFTNIVNPASEANMRRVFQTDPDTVGETDPFLRNLRAANSGQKQTIRAMGDLHKDVGKWHDERIAGTNGDLAKERVPVTATA